MPTVQATIRVSRTTSLADGLRAYRIRVNGKTVGKVMPGKSVDIPVSAGQHSVVAKVDWCGSQTLDVDVRAGEVVNLQCASNLRGPKIFLSIFYIMFLWNRYLTLTRADNTDQP
ncbi:MAG: hypothetical protein AAGD11_05355 [Planctomycetota bacterium]